MKILVWHGCYDDGWQGFIVKEAFKHPAKMSKGLLTRILEHGFAQKYWKTGDTIGDCFGGVGTTCIMGAYHGLKVIAVELEPEFVKLGNANIERHRARLVAFGRPVPTLIQGDSRRFAEAIDAAVTSPPYADSLRKQEDGIDWEKTKAKPTSGIHQARGASSHATYGSAPGQIARLDGSVTSPPWEANCTGSIGAEKWGDPKLAAAKMAASTSTKAHANSAAARERQFERDKEKTYGDSDGQIGKEKGETYWQAMTKVYASLFQALKPGGVAAIVVKDYVAKKKRVPLCDDTLRLLVHCGFEPIARAHAMLVRETTHAGLFGEETTKKQRKSFFRRLAESKGSPPIDYEEVLFVRKPL